jgi:hypothetical protein
MLINIKNNVYFRVRTSCKTCDIFPIASLSSRASHSKEQTLGCLKWNNPGNQEDSLGLSMTGGSVTVGGVRIVTDALC